MNLITPEEVDHIITKYVPKLGKDNPINVILSIQHNIKQFFKNAEESGTFTSRHLIIKIKRIRLSPDFIQNIITVNIRNDNNYRNNQLTPLQKNILGFPVHSLVIKNNFPSQILPLVNNCVKKKNMLFTDEQIILNNCNSIVPSILIYIIHHIDNIISLCYQHIGSEKVKKDRFTEMHQKYVKAVEKHEKKIERERIEKEGAEAARIEKERQQKEKTAQDAVDKEKKQDKYKSKVPKYLEKVNISNVTLSSREYNNYCALPEHQQIIFLKKKKWMEAKCGKSKPLFRTKKLSPKPIDKPNPIDKSKPIDKLSGSILEKYTQERKHTDLYKTHSTSTEESEKKVSFASMSEHAHLNQAYHSEHKKKISSKRTTI